MDGNAGENAAVRETERTLPGPGIGVLNERELHAFLKERCAPDPACREVRVGRYIADIVLPGENGAPDSIVEIQTRGFSPLRAKLDVFLREHPVTVVYPVAAVKRIVWVNPETGEASPPRRSPKNAGPWEIFYELVRLRDLLSRPGLRFRTVLLELTETRSLCGWGNGGKRGSVCLSRAPGAVLGECEAGGRFVSFLPPGLPPEFTLAQLAAAGRMSRTLAQRTLSVLRATGEAEYVGRRGREKLWRLGAGARE